MSQCETHNVGELHISDPVEWTRKLDRFKSAGIDELHVVSDWDRTLTRASTADNKDQSTYSLIVHGNYLGEDYNRRSQALFDAYRHTETSANIPRNQKIAGMQEWWSKQYELLIEFGFSTHVVRGITSGLQMRKEARAFFEILSQHNVPLLILSAGLKIVIEQYLEAEKLLTQNVHLIANTLIFDAEGKVRAYEKPLIHSLNKNEGWAKHSDYYPEIVQRKNVLLLGDTLEDIHMSGGMDHDCRVSFCFLNHNTRENLKPYTAAYDAVLLNDGTMDPVNSLLRMYCEK